jgi:hypothetical protein
LAVNLHRLYHEGVDGIVFADGEGMIRAANEAFLNLTDASEHGGGAGPFDRGLSRRGGQVDLRVLLDNVKRTGQLRLYATRLTTDYLRSDRGGTLGQLAERPAEPGAGDGGAGREPGGRPAPHRQRHAGRRCALGDGTGGVLDLKDIVAETTDVIEKMCIETALELTRNNRVAAADMLGLSRQSLYVKLRKYALLNKDGD